MSLVIINLGGEGEEPSAYNVQPARIGGSVDLALEHARRVAATSGQAVIMAEGNRLPLADRCADAVVVNDAPIGTASGYFGPHFHPDEIARILKADGELRGTSVS